MEIKCIVFGRGPRLVQALEMRGYKPREYNNSVVFSLRKKNGKYEVPLKSKFKLMIETTEFAANGKVFIVCDINGKPIRPYRHPYHLCDNTAYFQGEELCTIKAYSNSSMIAIIHHKIVLSGSFAQIVSSIIWSGKASNNEGGLPPHLKKFDKAVKAAKGKTGCRNCSCVHYAL